MRRVDAGEAILGSFDGLVSAAGIVAATAALASASHAVLVATVGAMIASGVSMAGGQWLSEGPTDWIAVAAIGVGTVAGFVPAVAWLALGPAAGLAFAVVLVAAIVAARSVRLGRNGWAIARTVAEVVALLLVAVALARAVGASS